MRARALVASAAALFCAVVGQAQAAEAIQVERGKYLVRIAGCGDCHTPGYFLGKPDVSKALAGSDVGFFIPGSGTDRACIARDSAEGTAGVIVQAGERQSRTRIS